MLEDLFPWLGTAFQTLLACLGACLLLAGVYFIAKFIKFMWTAR